MSDWLDIETAPKDGTVVDLWIVGTDNTVDVYSVTARKVQSKPIRHGRTTDWRWQHFPPNEPGWHTRGICGQKISTKVTPTHWMPLPEPPATKVESTSGPWPDPSYEFPTDRSCTN
jgi:hypothetical protein